MGQEWIKANLALEYVSESLPRELAAKRICERAHNGLIASKAERIMWSEQDQQDHLIGKKFWWAEGHEALEQDWVSGDFATWIDGKVEVKAFGVSFDFGALSELVPADKQALALRRISVLADSDWISAGDLYSAMQEKVGESLATAALAEACRLGQLGARAMRASCSPTSAGEHVKIWEAMEWDVPLWFWRDFTVGRLTHLIWALGKVRGEARREGFEQRIELHGVHFHRSGLINLGLDAGAAGQPAEQGSKRGRKPAYDWEAAGIAIWGQIYRGELIPENQAALEAALQAFLRKGDKEPSESTVRPLASKIWQEFSKA